MELASHLRKHADAKDASNSKALDWLIDASGIFNHSRTNRSSWHYDPQAVKLFELQLSG